ncbi:hypothetical protein [Bacillus phage PK2]|nr:hypothetical protein [Bacillus phage PK2]
MWIKEKESFFRISREERQVYNFKLEELYKSYGKYIEVLEDKPNPFFMDNRAIAYLEFNHITNEMELKVGQFWYEEENLCPVIAMTHELGHYVDIRDNFNGDYLSYNRILGTLELEVRAWEHAIEFCKQLGILEKHSQMVYDYAVQCVGTYFSAWRLPNDSRFGFTGRRPTFAEAKQRIAYALGMEVPHEEEKQFVEPVNLMEAWEQLKEAMRGSRFVAEINPESEEELTPLERVRKQKEKYRKTVKKGMGAKPWEL